MTTIADHRSNLDQLRSATIGQVITADDEAYEAARSVWNLSYQHAPALVVVTETTSDVVAAVRHARSEGLRIAVQTTGHGVGRVADEGAKAVHAELRRRLAPATTGGTYLNSTEGEEKQSRSASGFQADSLERLRVVKAMVDPTDVMSDGVDVTR